jgi:hypothetical protein
MPRHIRAIGATVLATGLGLTQAAAEDAAPAKPVAPAPAAPAAPLTLAIPPPTISGLIDFTYNDNLNRPPGGANQYHAYDPTSNTFTLNAADVALKGKNNTVEYAVEMLFGNDAKVLNGITYPVSASETALVQAYVAYTFPEFTAFGFKVGKFVTCEGVEVVQANGNNVITRGLLFNLAEPTTHVGAQATCQLYSAPLAGDETTALSMATGVVNGWDANQDNNDGKTLMVMANWTYGSALNLVVSGLYGPEQVANDSAKRLSLDMVISTKLIPRMELAVQGNFGREQGLLLPDDQAASWHGFGLWPTLHVGERFDLGLRGEVFDDRDGVRTGVKQRLMDLAIAPTFKLMPGLVVRGEYRIDVSDQQVFANRDGANQAKTQTVIGAEVICTF